MEVLSKTKMPFIKKATNGKYYLTRYASDGKRKGKKGRISTLSKFAL